MPLKATLDGRPIISALTSDEEWREAQKASKGGAKRLRMMDGAPAYATHSRRDLRYFAHKPNQEREASGGESEEHEDLKAAAARAVQSRAGWAADVEVLGEGWRADVLAVRGAVKIAIEVQLSAQAKRSTQTRNDRFEASEVTAFWLKGKSNHYNDFGDGLQAPVTGRARDERMTSVTSSVDDLLSKVERQIKLANALARWIRSIPGWTYKIEKQGTVPACFSLQRGRSKQQILLAELGPSLLPQTFNPRNGDQIGADQFSGAILQLRIAAPHLPGYYASSFELNEVDLYASLDRSLRPIMEGRVVWQGRQHREEVPGAFVHYSEVCPSCGTGFLRITHLLLGHPEHPKQLPCKPISNDWSAYKAVLPEAESLASAWGLPLGTIHASFDDESEKIRASQYCPECDTDAPEALISEDEALRYWPGQDAHFQLNISCPGTGWTVPTSFVERAFTDAHKWQKLLEQKRFQREEQLKEDLRRRELARAEQQQRSEDWSRRLEEMRLQRTVEEQERKAQAQRRRAEAELRRKQELYAKAEEARALRQDNVSNEARAIIQDKMRRELWLNSSNPKLRKTASSQPLRPIESAGESAEGLQRALAVLRASKTY